MSIVFEDKESDRVVKCLVLTHELNDKVRLLAESFPKANQSLVIRKILEEYFERNPVNGA